MRTYCKSVKLDENFILDSIQVYIADHDDNIATTKLFAWYGQVSRTKAKKLIAEDVQFVINITQQIASDMAWHIRTRTVREHVLMTDPEEQIIRYVPIIDGNNGKHRELGIEKMMLQLYEVVLRDALAPLFKAKVGVFQVAAIKKKGQSYGKRHMKRWLERDPDGTKYLWKADVHKCYPSIPREKLRKRLHRDVHKNKDVVYLCDAIIDLYIEADTEAQRPDPSRGILIGSPAAKDLSNYYLSDAYHYASEQIAVKEKRRGQEKRKRLLSHIMIYADDIVMTGGSKRDLRKAAFILIDFMSESLGLSIKDTWQMTKFTYVSKDGRKHGNVIDFMGIVFRSVKSSLRYYGKNQTKLRKVVTTVRDSIFLRGRRKFVKVVDKLKHKIALTQKYAMSFMAYNGWIKVNDTFNFQKKSCWKQISKIAARIIGRYAKEKPYETEYYYKKWRKLYA